MILIESYVLVKIMNLSLVNLSVNALNTTRRILVGNLLIVITDKIRQTDLRLNRKLHRLPLSWFSPCKYVSLHKTYFNISTIVNG